MLGKGFLAIKCLVFFIIGTVLCLLRPRDGNAVKPIVSIRPDSKTAKRSKTGKHKGRAACHVSTPMEAFCHRVQESGISEDREEIAHLFPSHFEVLNHVVILKLNPGVSPDTFALYAKAFAESLMPRMVDIVLLDTRGVTGELRRPQTETLWSRNPDDITFPKDSLRQTLRRVRPKAEGLLSCVTAEDLALFESYTDSPTFTTHVEKRVRYSLDVRRVMFCSGNGTERMHFATVSAKDEVVVDMFAGIGYFTLPLALNGGAQVIHALEKNRDSVVFLKYNALQNGVDHVVRTYCGDNREVGSELVGCCDRVMMGYLPSCEAFLPRAVSFLRLSAHGVPCGTLHYHYLSDKKSALQTAMKHAHKALGEGLVSNMRVSAVRIVKSYAPKRYHCVADLTFADTVTYS